MPATIVLLSTLAATEPQVEACGPKGGQGWLCSTVYRLSHSTGAAEVADALARPIRILFVIALAWISVRIARRAVMRPRLGEWPCLVATARRAESSRACAFCVGLLLRPLPPGFSPPPLCLLTVAQARASAW